MKIDVLGSEYEVLKRNVREDPKLGDDSGGYCDPTVRRIVIAMFEDDVNNCDDMDCIYKQTLRHEIIHAFAFESGLSGCSEWAMNEEMVDWVAAQFPKLIQSFEQAGAL